MPVINRRAPEGNAFAIMALVQRLLKDTGRKDEWPEVEQRMTSGDYDNLCQVAEEVSHGSISFEDDWEDE